MMSQTSCEYVVSSIHIIIIYPRTKWKKYEYKRPLLPHVMTLGMPEKKTRKPLTH